MKDFYIGKTLKVKPIFCPSCLVPLAKAWTKCGMCGHERITTMQVIPQPNEIWEHQLTKGMFYQVLFLTNIKSPLPANPETVVFEDTNTKEKYSMPLTQFNRLMTFHSKDLHR